jgi:hypothetical protein
MKNHLYLLVAMAMILSMVVIGCATPAPVTAPTETAAEGSNQPHLAAAETQGRESIMQMTERAHHHFAVEGVTVVTPDGLTAEERPFSFEQVHELPDNRNLIRPVVSFDLYDGGEKIGERSFADSPIEVWVRFTAADAKFAAEQGDQPVLVISWGDDEPWEIAEPVKLLPAERGYGGVAILTIEDWRDPRVAWAD